LRPAIAFSLEFLFGPDATCRKINGVVAKSLQFGESSNTAVQPQLEALLVKLVGVGRRVTDADVPA
jgi:hypothetical protein